MFLDAIRFLTIIRLPRRGEASLEQVARSQGLFPLVGLVIGLILAGLYWLWQLILPLGVVSGLLVVASVVLSGGLHLDGFVDTCDGIGGQKSPEARWQVMHDNRAGAFGIVGVFCLLLVKYVSLNSIPQNLVMLTLVLMPTLSRWLMVYVIFAYPYARPSGLGKAFKEEASLRKLIIATLIALAVAIPWFRLAGLVIMLGVWGIAAAMAGYLRRKFAGLTGDTYGAVNEVAEVSVLVLVSLLAHNRWLGLV